MQRESEAGAPSVEQIAAVLRQEASSALAGHPDLRHEWSDEGTVVTLRFPPADAHGFEVAVQAREGCLYVLMGRTHQPFDVDVRSPRVAVLAALGLIRDLLSPNMRLRELRSGGRPYRWFVESQDGTAWRLEAETGLLFFNYFGARSEHVFQNRQLPSRAA